jgi:Ser/Thr protein kinase RdoA (MazF antagonist)
VSGFGRRGSDGTWEFSTWQEAMDAAWRANSAERPWILQAGFTDRELEEMLRLIARYRDGFGCAQPVLCHSDFIPEHLFVDDELRVSAVIDCGDCRGDHPIHDFAAMGDEEGDVARIAEGYAATRPLPERFEERRHLHWLMLEIGYLAQFVRLRHPAAPGHAQWLRRLLEGLLERGW